jgi:hypothetical protein
MLVPADAYCTSERDAQAWIYKQLTTRSSVVVSYEDIVLPGVHGRSLLTGGGRSLQQPLSQRSNLASVGEDFALFPDTEAGPAQTGIVADDDDLRDDNPTLALADFDYQYHQWSRTHTGARPKDLPQDSVTARAPEPLTSLPPPSTDPITPRPPSPSAHEGNAGPSKIASLIAKAKAKPAASAGVLSSQSASQRRAAQHKGKHRKPIVETPPSPAPAPEPTKRRPFELMYDNSPVGRQRALALAVQEGIIDPNNDGQVARLMERLQESINRKKLEGYTAVMASMVQKGGAVMGVVREDEEGEERD